MKAFLSLIILISIAVIVSLGSKNCDIRDVPFYVYFWHTVESTSFSCGGSLISKTTVLTAAHCCDDHIVGDNITVGNPKQFPDCSQQMKIKNTTKHNNYFLDSHIPSNDFCIIELQNEIEICDTVSIATIARERDVGYMLKNDSQVLWNIGYGFVPNETNSQKYLSCFQGILNVGKSLAACKENMDKDFLKRFDTSSMFCYHIINTEDTDKCAIDPGSPILHNSKIVGIISWGSDIGLCFGSFKIAARIDPVLSWLRLQGKPSASSASTQKSCHLYLPLIIIFGLAFNSC